MKSNPSNENKGDKKCELNSYVTERSTLLTQRLANTTEGDEDKGKGKKSRSARAMYRQEVEAAKAKAWSILSMGNEDEKSANLPTPVQAPRQYVFPVTSAPSFL